MSSQKQNAKVAFIGLGVMGYPMAGHLLKAGHEVTVYNRTTAVSEKWQAEFGGNVALTPAEAARGADVVFTCVSNDAALRSVLLGTDGAFAGMKPGAVLWDDSTVSAEIAREMADFAEKAGLHFVDAPVSGGQSGAENAQLTMMCGGDEEIINKVLPIASAFAPSARRIGPSGHGQLAKMCNQICIAGVVQGLSEAIAFGKKADLDMKTVIDVISKGAASSWQMVNRSQTMIDGQFDFGFAVDLMRKDLGLCLEEAKHNKASLPVTALVDQFYGDVQRMGGSRYDTSSLILRLEDD